VALDFFKPRRSSKQPVSRWYWCGCDWRLNRRPDHRCKGRRVEKSNFVVPQMWFSRIPVSTESLPLVIGHEHSPLSAAPIFRLCDGTSLTILRVRYPLQLPGFPFEACCATLVFCILVWSHSSQLNRIALLVPGASASRLQHSATINPRGFRSSRLRALSTSFCSKS